MKEKVLSLLWRFGSLALADKKAFEDAAQVERVLESKAEVVQQVADDEEEERALSYARCSRRLIL